MGALALLGLSIAALGFPMGTTAGAPPASFSAIRLPAIAATADAKGNVAKTAFQANQKHNLALSRTKGRATINLLQRAFGPVPKVISKSPKCPFRASLFLQNTPAFNRLKQLTGPLARALWGLPVKMKIDHGQSIMNMDRARYPRYGHAAEAAG
jgi:hypothetical protein